MNERKLLDLVSLFGYRLAMAGAETYRVEESMTFILRTYGYESEVFCIPNCLSVSIDDPDGNPIYRMRRLGAHGNDLDCVERYSNLSRKICREKPDLDTMRRWIDETDRTRLHYSFPIRMLGGYLCGFGFSILFGGRLPDGIIAGFLGMVITYVDILMSRLHANPVFNTMGSAFCCALVGYFIGNEIFPNSPDASIIGSLMILVPGMLFTNAMRDIMYGDTNSGIIRSALVVLQSTAIALGTAAALYLSIKIWGPSMIQPKTEYSLLIQNVAAFIGCTSFDIQFNVHGKGRILCTLGGVAAWTAYYITNQYTHDVVYSMFIAALVAAFYAELMARARKYPAISYLVIANIPLFPGTGVYYTMFYAVQGNMEGFVDKGIETAAVAGAIALAVLLVSTCFRMWSTYAFHRRFRRKNA